MRDQRGLSEITIRHRSMLAGEQETAPNEGTHSVKNSPELVDGKLCRIVHPTTLSHFAPGILHSPGCYWLLGVVVGDGVAAGPGNALKVSIRSFQVSP